MSGSGHATAPVAASGDPGIDGLLGSLRWADGAISYSDPGSAAHYQPGHPERLTAFQPVSATQMTAVRFALDADPFAQPSRAGAFSVEGFTNLGIDDAGPGSGAGTIRVANTSDPDTAGAAAYAYLPDGGPTGGDVFFGTPYRNPATGNFDWYVALHELGHALGLKHPHETSGFGAMPPGINSHEFTVMSYRSHIGAADGGALEEPSSFPQTYMMYDIAALQHLYGADYTAQAGDTTYRWTPSDGTTWIDGQAAILPTANRIFLTLWDGGGTDTYDLSAYATGLALDLRPGGHSVFSAAQLADLDQFSTDPAHVARGNVFNAMLHQGDPASLIENAIGGSGDDAISGNLGTNRLIGRGGIDKLLGRDGRDTLVGGAGGDRCVGGGGNDTFVILGLAHAGDRIADFGDLPGNDDRFRIGAAAFGGGLAAGVPLDPAQFQRRADNLAQDADDRFIFRTTDATLWFDSNGDATGGLSLLADLQAGATVAAGDILLT